MQDNNAATFASLSSSFQQLSSSFLQLCHVAELLITQQPLPTPQVRQTLPPRTIFHNNSKYIIPATSPYFKNPSSLLRQYASSQKSLQVQIPPINTSSKQSVKPQPKPPQPATSFKSVNPFANMEIENPVLVPVCTPTSFRDALLKPSKHPRSPSPPSSSPKTKPAHPSPQPTASSTPAATSSQPATSNQKPATPKQKPATKKAKPLPPSPPPSDSDSENSNPSSDNNDYTLEGYSNSSDSDSPTTPLTSTQRRELFQ